MFAKCGSESKLALKQALRAGPELMFMLSRILGVLHGVGQSCKRLQPCIYWRSLEFIAPEHDAAAAKGPSP